MTYDIIIVGTGFASSFFLHKLSRFGEKKILVLERGAYETHADQLKSRTTKDYALKKAKETFENTGDKPWIFTPAFGGSSNCWWGCTPRMLPNDFKLHSKYGVGIDWPITYNELEKHYCEAEKIMDISGNQDVNELPYPMSKSYPLPPHKFNNIDTILHNKYDKLYISQPTARPSRTVDSRPKCCAAGVCVQCPIDSKFTILNSMENLYKSKDITIEYNAQVYKLLKQNSIIKGVSYHKNGKDIDVYAKTVVLGANALFNPHILLNSDDNHEWTGKGLSEQVSIFIQVYYKNIKNFTGSTSVTGQGFMFYDGNHRFEHAASIIEHWNIPQIRYDNGKFLNVSTFKFIFEDIPDKKNYVTLSNNILMPKIIYTGHSGYTEKGIKEVDKKLKIMLDNIEIDGYKISKEVSDTEGHILGTTRMGKDSKDSVVDKNLVHHKYRNLIILGGSVFPTVSPSNPTLTIAALSLYAAEKYLEGKL